MNSDKLIRSVYKYYSINQNLYNSIINNELFFSNPRTFNDPFDSNPRFQLSTNADDLLNFFLYIQECVNEKSETLNLITNIEKKQLTYKFLIDTYIKLIHVTGKLHDISKKSQEERLIEIFTFYNNVEYFQKFNELNSIELQKKMFDDFIFLSIAVKSYGIWSASVTATCPVMWGHYANNHQGICLEFELFDEKDNHYINYPEDSSFKLIEVNYTNDPLDIFSLKSNELKELTDVVINTKYTKWSYEKEVRLIHHEQGLVKFNFKSIKRIIFGYRTDPRDRYALCKLFGSLRYQSKLFVSRVQPDNYELKITEMTYEDIAGSGVKLDEINDDAIRKFTAPNTAQKSNAGDI